MSSVVLWLLVSLPGGGGGYNSNVPTASIARFADAQECERVRSVILAQRGQAASQPLMCIQAKVIP